METIFTRYGDGTPLEMSAVAGGKGTAAEKQKAMEKAGRSVCPSPDAIGKTVQEALESVA